MEDDKRTMPKPMSTEQFKDFLQWLREAGTPKEILEQLLADGGRMAVPDLSHVGAELHAKWAAEEAASLVDPPPPEQTAALLEKLGLPQESKRMSPERHAQFLQELRWAGASEEIVKAMEAYPTGTEATYENGYRNGYARAVQDAIAMLRAVMKRYKQEHNSDVPEYELDDLIAKLQGTP